jgi:hypothetical protein
MFRRLLLIAVSILFALPGHAEVVRIEVKSRGDLLAGKSFGSTGPYEKIAGRIYFAVDPSNSANRIVADIDKAPKNRAGKVEFSSDFYMLKPKDLIRGNGTLLYEVSNRGNKGMLGFFNLAAGSLDPATPEQVGDGFLMEQGFTLLWVGWQFDVAGRDGLVRAYVPIAREADGKPIQGLVRSDFIPSQKTMEAALPDAVYAVLDPKDVAHVLTVRDTVLGARRTIPRGEWEFTASGDRIRLSQGFEPGKIYEVVYKSQDPPVAGLGAAAVRDAVSRLKYGDARELGVGRGAVRRAIAFGISQSGRFLRTYLYDGFNEDESHRKVFDGVMSHVAGGGRGSFNHRFAMPGRTAGPFTSFFYPVDVFPFTDIDQIDPETGRRDGLLNKTKPEFMPRIMYTNSSHEYWGRAASLTTTTVDGSADVALMPNVRVYVYASGSHGVGGFPPARGSGQQFGNPLDYRWAARPLLVSLNRWIADDVAPPSSVYPRIIDGTLVSADRVNLPLIPDLRRPNASNVHQAYRIDYGVQPPTVKAAFPMLVPQTNGDGNDIAGIRLPELAIPLATYLGWNFYNDRSGPSDKLVALTGGFVPFPRTRAERDATSDPRPAIEERYATREQYLALIIEYAEHLAGRGYLRKEDIVRIVQQAGVRWDWIMSQTH